MKWEYKVLENVLPTELNILGQDGWELVSVVSRPPVGNVTAYLKREYVKKEKVDPVQQMILEEANEVVKVEKKKTKKKTK
jgi:hypothetical protein